MLYILHWSKSNGVFRLYLIQTSSIHRHRLQMVLQGHRCEPVASCAKLYEVEARANVVDIAKTWEKNFILGGFDSYILYIGLQTQNQCSRNSSTWGWSKFWSRKLSNSIDRTPASTLYFMATVSDGAKWNSAGSIRCTATARAGRADFK